MELGVQIRVYRNYSEVPGITWKSVELHGSLGNYNGNSGICTEVYANFVKYINNIIVYR